jgi:magnesium transporter
MSHLRPTEREVVPMSKFDTRTAVPSVDTSEPERPAAPARTVRGVRSLPRLLRSRGQAELPADEEPRGEPRVEEVHGPSVRWLNIDEPRLVDRVWLAETFGFHELDLEDVASHNQRPKLDEYDEYMFLVMHFPRYDKDTGRLHSAELDVFIGPDYVITLPNEPIVPLPALFERAESRQDFRDQLMSKGSGYLLYHILDRAVDAGFPMLGQLGRKLRRLEDDIFEGRSSEIVRDISNAKQEIINFRSVIRPQRAVFRSLERAKQRYLTDDLDIYFDDLTDASERIWDVLENFMEIVQGLESTNESVISHRLNDVLRVLTAFSVILLPLTLLASIFGMNVHFPGTDSAEGFWIVIGTMVVILVGMVAFFRRRGWL